MHFIEPESSLPLSQEPFISPSPEPDESSPHSPILFLDPLQYYPAISAWSYRLDGPGIKSQ